MAYTPVSNASGPIVGLRSRCEEVGVDFKYNQSPSVFDPAAMWAGAIWFNNRGTKLVRIDSDGETYYIAPKETLDLKLHGNALPLVTGLNNGI
jgi:hypothetical protein